MVSHWAKGMGVWILSFLSFLAGLNALNAIVLWALDDGDGVFEPYLISGFMEEMQVLSYFWASTTALFLFLGLTAIIVFSKPPPDPAILSEIASVEEELATNKAMLESTQIGFYQRLEDNERAREELLNEVNATLHDVREKIVDILKKQEEEIQKVRETLSFIRADLAGARGETASALEKQEESMQNVLLSSIENSVSAIKEEILGALEKQMEELANSETRYERLEEESIEPG